MKSKFIFFVNSQKSWILVLFLFVFFAGFSYLVKDIKPIACDMAEYLNNPLRVINGDIPYKDFWLLFPPGEVFIPALVYKIFGLNIDVLRFASILMSCLVPVVSFFLGKLLFNDNFKAIITSFIFYFLSVVSNYEGPDYIHLYLLFILLTVFFVIKYIYSTYTNLNKYGFLFYAGIYIGLAFLFKLYEVGGVFVGLMTFILIIKNNGKYNIKPGVFYLAGFLVVALVFSLLLSNVFTRMFNELVVESLKNGTSMNLPYFNDLYYVWESIKTDISAIKSSPKEIINLIYHILKFITTLGFYVLPFISLFFLIYIKRLSKIDKSIALVILIWAVMSFPKALGRADLAHLAPSVAPFALFILFVGYKLKEKSKLLSKGAYIIIGVMLLTVIFPIIKLGATIKSPNVFVSTSHGSVLFKDKKEAENFKNTIDYIENNTTDDDYIFVTLWDAPPIYALTNSKNPTYYDSLNDLMIRRNPDKQKKIIDELISKKTKYIIHNADWGYDNKPEQQFRVACDILQGFIESSCIKVAEFGFYKIYEIDWNNFNNHS